MNPSRGHGGKREQVSFGCDPARFTLACQEAIAGSFIKGGGIIPAWLLWGGDSLWHTESLGGKTSEVIGTIATQDLLVVRDEALAHQRGGTAGTGEAVVVPVAVLKGDVLASSKACDGLGASAAFLCIEVPKALDAVWLVILRGELLPGQGRPAARADKTLLVPRLIPVSDATLGQ